MKKLLFVACVILFTSFNAFAQLPVPIPGFNSGSGDSLELIHLGSNKIEVDFMEVDSITRLRGKLHLEDGITVSGDIEAIDNIVIGGGLRIPNLDSTLTLSPDGFIVLSGNGTAVSYSLSAFSNDLKRILEGDSMDFSKSPIIASSLNVEVLTVDSIATFAGNLNLSENLSVNGNMDVRDELNAFGKVHFRGLENIDLQKELEEPTIVALGANSELGSVSLSSLSKAVGGTTTFTGQEDCIIYDLNGPVGFRPNMWYNNGAEKLFTSPCYPTSKVGINTQDPQYALDVYGEGQISKQFRVGDFDFTDDPVDAPGHGEYSLVASGAINISTQPGVKIVDAQGQTKVLSNNSIKGDQSTIYFGDKNHSIGRTRFETAPWGVKNGMYIKTYHSNGLFLQEYGGVGINFKTEDSEHTIEAELHIFSDNVERPSFKISNENRDVLSVKGDRLYARDITVTEDNFPDYVFEKDYKLLSLFETERFIKQNKRLPKMPSAEEVKEKGMELDEVTRLLVEKVEELTLHMIELKKENEALRKELINKN